jgi:DegV family protein with EDD domain
MAVAVVTDSTACLSAELAAGGGIRIVPLRVVLGNRAADEATDDNDATDNVGAAGEPSASRKPGMAGEPGRAARSRVPGGPAAGPGVAGEPGRAAQSRVPRGPVGVGDGGGGAARDPAGCEDRADLAAAITVADVEAVLRAGGRVGTASPSPVRFAAAYAAAAAAGAESIVSVHLSARLSGTLNSASLAAATAPVPVRVVDSQSIGMGLGLAVLAAAAAAQAGRDADAVAAAAAGRAARLRSIFALDTPGYLQAGGRLERTPALPSSGLTTRPLLHIRDGRIVLLEKARTPAGAIGRLEQLAAEFAADQPVDLAVQYLGEAGRATAFAGRLAERIPGVRHIYLAAAGAVICAHTGPGMLGVVVAPY